MLLLEQFQGEEILFESELAVADDSLLDESSILKVNHMQHQRDHRKVKILDILP